MTHVIDYVILLDDSHHSPSPQKNSISNYHLAWMLTYFWKTYSKFVKYISNRPHKFPHVFSLKNIPLSSCFTLNMNFLDVILTPSFLSPLLTPFFGSLLNQTKIYKITFNLWSWTNKCKRQEKNNSRIT